MWWLRTPWPNLSLTAHPHYDGSFNNPLKAGGLTIKVVRVRITAAGRRAIENKWGDPKAAPSTSI